MVLEKVLSGAIETGAFEKDVYDSAVRERVDLMTTVRPVRALELGTPATPRFCDE